MHQSETLTTLVEGACPRRMVSEDDDDDDSHNYDKYKNVTWCYFYDFAIIQSHKKIFGPTRRILVDGPSFTLSLWWGDHNAAQTTTKQCFLQSSRYVQFSTNHFRVYFSLTVILRELRIGTYNSLCLLHAVFTKPILFN